ncbi:MAG: hypothetical protein ACRYFY_21150 [Janthinobacterium lividum]
MARGEAVLGLDNLNGYYDPALKRARLDQLHGLPATGSLKRTSPIARAWPPCSPASRASTASSTSRPRPVCGIR